MRATLDLSQPIGGMRVSSITRSEINRYRFTSKASEATRDLAERIPFWPQAIRMHELMMATGLSKTSITSRISACHGEFLIFSDRGKLSRLKPDLSNCK